MLNLTFKLWICISVLWQQIFSLCRAHGYLRFLLSLWNPKDNMCLRKNNSNIYLAQFDSGAANLLQITLRLLKTISFLKNTEDPTLYCLPTGGWAPFTFLVLVTETFTFIATKPWLWPPNRSEVWGRRGCCLLAVIGKAQRKQEKERKWGEINNIKEKKTTSPVLQVYNLA